MSDVKTAVVSAEKIADCINHVTDILGRDLVGVDRKVVIDALDYAYDENPNGYTGDFNLGGGYGDKLNDVIFAVVRFLGRDQSATDGQKRRFQHIARVAMG